MKEDLKLDVAIQVISNRLAEAMKNEDRKKITELLKLKKQVYLGNQEVIDMLTENKGCKI